MRLPRGLTQTPAGWRISRRVGGVLHQRRFPPDTPMETLERELLKARGARARGSISGTLRSDVARYLTDYFTGRSGHAERKRHLHLWIDALGPDRVRGSITRDDVSRILHQWRAAGLAADTCNKRRTALLALFHALDGKGGSNPVREVPKFRSPDPLPRGLAYAQIEKALAKLPDTKTRARLAVMAYTGIRQSQLAQLTPDHWDHRQHVLTVPGTQKGKGTKPYVVPLSAPAQEALKALDRLDGWGPFTTAPMARLWREAWYAMMTKQPRTPRMIVPASFVAPVPYDLRHSFGTAIYQATGDLHAARTLLGHSSIRMTERYTLAAVPVQQRAAVKAFGVLVKKR